MITVERNEPGIGDLVKATFPNNRKPIRVEEFRGPMTCNSYWDGGSRDDYVLINLDTREVWRVPTSHPFFDRKENGDRCGNLQLSELPENTALVCGGVFCGKKSSIRVLLRKENMVALLPDSVELMEHERMALNVIAGLKGGYRKDEWNRRNIPGEYNADNPIIIDLAEKGLVKINKRGAVSVTVAGRNAR